MATDDGSLYALLLNSNEASTSTNDSFFEAFRADVNDLATALIEAFFNTPLRTTMPMLFRIDPKLMPKTTTLSQGDLLNDPPIVKENRPLMYKTVEDTTTIVDPTNVCHFVFSMRL